MRLNHNEDETIVGIKEALHHLAAMDKLKRRGMYRQCELRRYNKHAGYAKKALERLVNQEACDGSQQLEIPFT